MDSKEQDQQARANPFSVSGRQQLSRAGTEEQQHTSAIMVSEVSKARVPPADAPTNTVFPAVIPRWRMTR
jgi:hypothetical protein